MLSLKNWNLCPRNCGIDRSAATGFCGAYDRVKISKYMLHYWEEPCISGKRGSGAVFFSGCNLRCVYCQNHKISREYIGETVDANCLSEIFLYLQDKGAHNINLVTPTHYSTEIIKALDKVKQKLDIPVVYNTGGYEREEAIKALNGYIDIYIQDIKYSDNTLSESLSKAPDYFEIAKEATRLMLEQTGGLEFSKRGILKQGVIIRHLVLPEYTDNSIGVLDFLKTLDKNKFILSLMSQFTPTKICLENKILQNRLTPEEYKKVTKKALELGLDNGYFQEIDSASEEFIPDF